MNTKDGLLVGDAALVSEAKLAELIAVAEGRRLDGNDYRAEVVSVVREALASRTRIAELEANYAIAREAAGHAGYYHRELSAAVSKVAELERIGGESFRLAVFHQERANKAEAERDSAVEDARRMREALAELLAVRNLARVGDGCPNDRFEAAWKAARTLSRAPAAKAECGTCGGFPRAYLRDVGHECPDCAPAASEKEAK